MSIILEISEINSYLSGASDYHRTPQDTIGHPRTVQEHHRTVPVYLKLLRFIMFLMYKSLFFNKIHHLVHRNTLDNIE